MGIQKSTVSVSCSIFCISITYFEHLFIFHITRNTQQCTSLRTSNSWSGSLMPGPSDEKSIFQWPHRNFGLNTLWPQDTWVWWNANTEQLTGVKKCPFPTVVCTKQLGTGVDLLCYQVGTKTGRTILFISLSENFSKLVRSSNHTNSTARGGSGSFQDRKPTKEVSASKPLGKPMFRDFSTISRTLIFFLLTLSLLWSSFRWLFLFSDCSYNCCCICP